MDMQDARAIEPRKLDTKLLGGDLPSHAVLDLGVPTRYLSITEAIKCVLAAIGEKPGRGGLQDTPLRIAKAYDEWFGGYREVAPAAILKAFEDGAELMQTDEMVIVRDIDFYSFCEHHMAPFFGKVHIGYIPQGKVVGLSKLARLTDLFSRRLQVQERLTGQIADALQDNLQPLGVGVVVRGTHFCMCSRGVNKQGSTTITSALRGTMKDEPSCRAEFLRLLELK